ncbi:hypothetical protein AB4039_32435 [Streptomyces sp. M-16]|uniref:hypothetical protein n=1 Tax=Streptomyces sp. M-16 TaxID=3233040 RepID=UPI003F9C79C6
MKLKRMAVVAAAAVVGPTVLMATPAMADEVQNPAITTPDAAPKDDAVGAADAKPAAETPAAPAADAKPAAQTPAPAQDAKPAPAKDAKPAPAKPGDKGAEDADEYKEGPKLGLRGLPAAGFSAGGDWTEVTLTVDNSGIQGFKDYGFAVLGGNDDDTLHSKHLDIQIFNGTKWVAADKDPSGQTAGTVFDSYVDKGEVFTVKLRMKFSKDAPVGNIQFVVAGGSNDVDEPFASDTQFFNSKITSASTGGNTGGNTGGHNNTGGNTGGHNNGGGNTGGHNNGGGNDSKPNGGGTTTPIVLPGNGGTTNTGGQLAETGTDAATSWALGAGGVALAMGAALVAGTGRRRRTTA